MNNLLKDVKNLKIAYIGGGSRGWARTLMTDLAKEGMTMVIVTHEMSFAREVGTRVLFVDEGQIKEENTPKEFFDNPQNPRLKEFLSKVL